MPEIIKTNHFVYSGVKVEIPDLDDDAENQAVTPPSDEDDKELMPEEAEHTAPESEERREPEVKTIIKEVYLEPEPLTREEIKRIYKDEIAEICRQAAATAYREARAAKETEIKSCLAKVETILQELRSEQDQYMERYVRELKYLAIDVAEKMINKKIEEDDTILERLVLQTVSGLLNSQWLRVEVSDRLTNLVEHLKTELTKPEYRGQVTVTPVAAPQDTCRVVTETGATDATISVQAENLRRAFSEADCTDA